MCMTSRATLQTPGASRYAAWLRWLNPIHWPALFLLAVIVFHRQVISRITPPTCRFTPSCSRYGLDAIQRYGAIRGGWLVLWRVLRCNPIHSGGYDPLL